MKKKAEKKPPAPPRQNTWRMWGILNAFGDPWTPETFESKAAGEAYLDAQRKQWKVSYGLGLHRHKVAPVSVTVRTVKPKKGESP